MKNPEENVYYLIVNKMNRYLLFILMSVFLLSCTKKQEKHKENYDILKREKLISVLADCYIIEGILNTEFQNSEYKKEYTKYYYDFVFKKHNVTREQIFGSMKYYSYRIKDLSKIYTEISNRLPSVQPSRAEETE